MDKFYTFVHAISNRNLITNLYCVLQIMLYCILCISFDVVDGNKLLSTTTSTPGHEFSFRHPCKMVYHGQLGLCLGWKGQ